MSSTLVTIIVLSYNHEQFLEEAIEAVHAQTHKNVQLIVTDDFSSDGSQEKIKDLQQLYGFETVLNEANKGMNATLLQALSHARGEYIAIISADDYMLPEKTARQLTYLINNQKDGVYSNGYSLKNQKRRLINLHHIFDSGNKNQILSYVYQHDWAAPLLQSGLFKINVFRETMPLRLDYKSDDWAFLISVFENYNIGFLNEPLFCYRLHDDNTYKKYWFTFPMRVDVVSRLVPEKYRVKATGNIIFSQGQYLMHHRSFFSGLRMQLAGIIINFSMENIGALMKTTASYFVSKFAAKGK